MQYLTTLLVKKFITVLGNALCYIIRKLLHYHVLLHFHWTQMHFFYYIIKVSTLSGIYYIVSVTVVCMFKSWTQVMLLPIWAVLSVFSLFVSFFSPHTLCCLVLITWTLWSQQRCATATAWMLMTPTGLASPHLPHLCHL